MSIVYTVVKRTNEVNEKCHCPVLKCGWSVIYDVQVLIFRDVKSSRPKWPRGQNFGLGLGLGLEALASASDLASNIWPRPAAEEPAAKCQEETDQFVYRTSHNDTRRR